MTRARSSEQLEAEIDQLRRELDEAQESFAAERERSEALQQGLSELEAAFNSLPIGIAVSNGPRCSTIRGNQRFAELFGLPPETGISKPAPAARQRETFRAMRNDRELSADELPMQIAAATGCPVLNAELDVVHHDGRVVNVSGNADPLFDEHGEIRGAIGAFGDVSERKQIEEASQEVDRCKDEFLTSLVAELRNPLAGIVRGVKVLRSVGSNDGEKMQELIERQVEHMNHVVNTLFDALTFPEARSAPERRSPHSRAKCSPRFAAATH